MRKFLVIITLFSVFLSAGVVYGAPIHDAAKNGNSNQVEQLLKSGVPVDTLDQFGRSALWQAAWSGQYAVAELLLRSGANPNLVEKNNGNKNPTDAAYYNGKTAVYQLLKKHGGKWNYKASWNP